MPRANRLASATLMKPSALEREKVAGNEALRRQVDETFADPRPNVPAQDVFKRLKSHHARRVRDRRCKKT
jgi:hypothetical protein